MFSSGFGDFKPIFLGMYFSSVVNFLFMVMCFSCTCLNMFHEILTFVI